jgi:hypothetical protein
MQNDFCPGGALAVKDGENIIEPINRAQEEFDTIILTQDWHPKEHSSFASNHNAEVYSKIEMDYGSQILWPNHYSYFSDYPLKKSSAGSMNIDNKKVLGLRVINSSDTSRRKHAIIDGLMKEDINLLLSGSRLTIEVQGVDNSYLVDQFSLMGFTKSINYLLSSCN